MITTIPVLVFFIFYVSRIITLTFACVVLSHLLLTAGQNSDDLHFTHRLTEGV